MEKIYNYLCVILTTVFSFAVCNSLHAQSLNEDQIHGETNRSEFIESGWTYEIGYTGDVFSNLSGGIGNQSFYLDNFDVVFDFDLQKIIGLEGASFHIYGLGNNGGTPSEYAGAIQGISNIAAYDTWKLYELWYEQKLFNEKLSLLFGLWDLNFEFDSREASSVFINPSNGIGAEFAMTGKNGPSIFPTTSLALRMNYSLTPTLKLKFAIMDGVPGNPDKLAGTQVVFGKEDGILLATELNYDNLENGYRQGYFKYALGMWYYSSEFEKIIQSDVNTPQIKNGNWGVYGFAEGFVFNERNSPEQGLAVFLRAGLADYDINLVNSYIGAGIHYVGLIPERDNDEIGLGIAAANYKCEGIEFDEGQDQNGNAFECILELTYKAHLTNWMVFQPDIQYVINPAACYQNNYSFVVGTRMQIIL